MNSTKLTATLILSGLCLYATSIAAKTFEIDVIAAGLPAFTDCLTFEGGGEFRLGRDPLKMSWTNDTSGPFFNGLMATMTVGHRMGTTLRLGIHARIYNEWIVGNMVNSYGQTFMFHGTANEQCQTRGVLHAGSSEYSTLPIFDVKPIGAWPDDEIPGPILERLMRPTPVAQFLWPFSQAYEPPPDCFGFQCGLPQQFKHAGAQLVVSAQHDSPVVAVYRPPIDCFGFNCGPPPQPRNAVSQSYNAAQYESPIANVFRSPYDCFGSDCDPALPPVTKPPQDCLESDCPPRPDDPTSANNAEGRTSMASNRPDAEIVQSVQDCYFLNCGFPPKPVKPIYDCLESDCSPGPIDPRRSSDTVGDPSVVVGKTYRVILRSDRLAEKLIGDCWKFAADGRLENKVTANLVWRMDSNNSDSATFQTVGTNDSHHGMAFHGRASSAGTLEVSGIQSFRDEITRFSGHAYLVPDC